jgi:hypothetical protein
VRCMQQQRYRKCDSSTLPPPPCLREPCAQGGSTTSPIAAPSCEPGGGEAQAAN